VTLVAAPSRQDRRSALLSPHQSDHERSVALRMRQPHTLRQLVRELEDAHQAECVTRLHQSGVEWDGAGGSHLGTPRWTVAFRSYITGSDCDTTQDGDWRWPLRSSVFRLSISRSGTDRLAAAFVFLLIHNRFHIREAWSAQCGILADPAIADAAEAWAMVALSRWWGRFVEAPLGSVA
jgi:hypothetical protein